VYFELSYTLITSRKVHEPNSGVVVYEETQTTLMLLSLLFSEAKCWQNQRAQYLSSNKWSADKTLKPSFMQFSRHAM